ncbi:SMI1/KNR4 family protein [Brevifollis gellanilyticus]|uniref:DUF1851 domain-containing protein n=1 Tax=Brevifollis gellanilyticus TaxID=748831 RepID=A0A512M9K3_9BACT|nr:SMI1/KNR4 family protein [Brevifollis gellanilyticus]GEP43416.1 hypothetical protein BGE01nite_27070 [Brevifollis gellanilyticus]
MTWQGDVINDVELLGELPSSLVRVLREVNGFILHGGALHIRGASMTPEWHSLRAAMQGPAAFHGLYEGVHADDIPFGQDLFGDQFLLRDEAVLKLSAESGEVESMADSLDDFFRQTLEDLEGFLNVDLKHVMQPGQLLLAYPPFVFAESGAGASLKPVSAGEVILFHADLARQIRDVPEGGQIEIKWGA